MGVLQHRVEALHTAHHPWYGRTIPKQTEGKRSCGHIGCPTLLSRYNAGSFCFLHDPNSDRPTTASGFCEWCDTPFASSVRGGSPQKYCNNLCRNRAQRARDGARKSA